MGLNIEIEASPCLQPREIQRNTHRSSSKSTKDFADWLNFSFILQEWTDERLTWEPQKYSNISDIVVSAGRIWLPELAVINGYVPCDLERSYYLRYNIRLESLGIVIFWHGSEDRMV